LIERKPILSLNGWLIITWLAIVNTAFAYVLYNHALKTITALEMNVLLNLSPLGTALMAWLILGEILSSIQIIGVLIVIVGVTIVQIAGNRKKDTSMLHNVSPDRVKSACCCRRFSLRGVESIILKG
jgi:drug/metabolite transporter (DMT)-like permease